jgi:hypothetical protein
MSNTWEDEPPRLTRTSAVAVRLRQNVRTFGPADEALCVGRPLFFLVAGENNKFYSPIESVWPPSVHAHYASQSLTPVFNEATALQRYAEEVERSLISQQDLDVDIV